MQQIQLIEHSHWARFRIQWADFRNANRSSNDPTVSPRDLIELPFDKEQEDEQVKPPSFKELKAQLGSKFKRDVGAK